MYVEDEVTELIDIDGSTEYDKDGDIIWKKKRIRTGFHRLTDTFCKWFDFDYSKYDTL